jgi:hypothetical protein
VQLGPSSARWPNSLAALVLGLLGGREEGSPPSSGLRPGLARKVGRPPRAEGRSEAHEDLRGKQERGGGELGTAGRFISSASGEKRKAGVRSFEAGGRRREPGPLRVPPAWIIDCARPAFYLGVAVPSPLGRPSPAFRGTESSRR